MKIIGLDFGTTNSTISFIKHDSDTPESFKRGAAANDYIPSVVSYNKGDNHDISIGDTAKMKIASKDFDVYENFKLRLGKNFDRKNENESKTPIQVTHDFFKNLLDIYKKSQHIDGIDRIVMTVPEIWFREESNRTAGENIEGIFEELGYSDFELHSEPVAAAAYFRWAFEHNKESNPEGNKYNGFITVIDYGGGTLDVTLCEAMDDDTIKILERCGFGEYNDTNGCAGVAFDEAVIEKLIRDKGLSISKDSKKFITLRNKFEEWKIKDCDNITKYMKYYYDDPALVKGKPLFSLEYNEDGETMDVHCDDLDWCFNKVNAPQLRKSLEQVKQYFQAHKIDDSAQENFKVLLVGGFSNFIVVEKEVRAFFGSTMEDDIDERFKQPFPIVDRALSISKGAARIAKGSDRIITTCTHSYGYITFAIGESDQVVDNYVQVIEKGTDIKELVNSVFAKDPVQVKNKTGKISIFIDDGRADHKGRLRKTLYESTGELFPNIDDKNNEYYIGFSVNKNQIPTIHIKDKHDNVKSTSLSKLFEGITVA